MRGEFNWSHGLSDAADKYEGRLRRRRRWLFRLVSCFLVVVLAVVVAKLIFVRAVTVGDQSMYPNIAADSEIWCLQGAEPQIGDIVLVDFDGNLALRRLIAGPGSTVGVVSGDLEIDGESIQRPERSDHIYYSRSEGAVGVRQLTCTQVTEEIGELQVDVCALDQTSRDEDSLELSNNEYYVRCDNRAFCARRETSEGVVDETQIRGRALWLMATRDDSELPFYKRWFGRFESLN